MSLIAATAIAVKDDLPYFLVEKNSENYQFFTAKMHRHNHDTSLGAVLRAFKALGPIDFDQWRLGELTSVKNNNTLMSLYAFEVSDMSTIESKLDHKLMFVPANKLHKLLESVQTRAFVRFEE
ncbi:MULTISPECIES: hypothetical protein [Leuconostoc]|uniref:Uncharacterized protein n=3 Tax=Leuconostoc TaxID=1243 RepID=A0AAN2QTK8_9LACO|nr:MULTISPECIES: hypothetical protein [Leuconostoc]MBR2277092.1 hypothetical protein [Leuconostoc sp.]MBZ5944444.1 hypothetical protein [Leuconostoc gasicomitatum]MBZ5945281.1 hypothetical protein [Leuconostoc gasicomitatum]MBZ5946958.1 hypothetical protein [Leuconostoc gasicomitatum]MBZ5950346.1 hypothetical protein [Leuconostoc gasicomitatum]